MPYDSQPSLSNRNSEKQDLPAGDFSAWLRATRESFTTEKGTEVDCEECIACCSSSQFIHIRPEETNTLGRIRKELLVAAPGLPKGHMLLGYDKKGYCPMLVNGKCSIYNHRPLTCRNYDCRVFAAAGITPGDGVQARITQQVERWQFNYPTKGDREEHTAVKAAATFIREHAACFPGGKTPAIPSHLAVLAIKVYDVFLKKKEEGAGSGQTLSDRDIAHAIVKSCRSFDANAR